MSIDYYGVTIDDLGKIGDLLEGRLEPPTKIDVAAVTAALAGIHPKAEVGAQELNWENDSGYVQAHVSERLVEIHHNGGIDEELLMDVLMQVMEVLDGRGVRVYDPQNGDWLS